MPNKRDLTDRIVDTNRLLKALDDYPCIDPRLMTTIRKALKTAILADVKALTTEEETNASRPTN